MGHLSLNRTSDQLSPRTPPATLGSELRTGGAPACRQLLEFQSATAVPRAAKYL